MVYKGLTDTIYKIKYLRWNSSFAVTTLDTGNTGPFPTGSLTYTKSPNTILAVETSFSYTIAVTAVGSDVVYSFLRLTYDSTTIDGNQIQQRWGNTTTAAGGSGTRSATLPQCNVFLDASNVSGNITIGLFFNEGTEAPFLDDGFALRPGYFKVTEIWA
jgi:hypothetical protein